MSFDVICWVLSRNTASIVSSQEERDKFSRSKRISTLSRNSILPFAAAVLDLSIVVSQRTSKEFMKMPCP